MPYPLGMPDLTGIDKTSEPSGTIDRNLAKCTDNLVSYPMDENGLLIGKDMPYAFSHRHYSHLLAIYPLYLLNTEQPGAVDTIEKSLAFWQSKPKALQGYSCTGASSISSAIGKGNDALSYLNKLFGEIPQPYHYV